MSSSLRNFLALLGTLTLLTACIPLPSRPILPPEEPTPVVEKQEDTAAPTEKEEEEDTAKGPQAAPTVTPSPAPPSPSPSPPPSSEKSPPTPTPSPSPTPETTPQAQEPRQVKVDVANWSFTPSTIRAKQGEDVTLVLRGESGTHGFAIPALGINMSIGAGETKTVILPTALKGTYDLFCSIPCGSGHARMRGSVVIE